MQLLHSLAEKIKENGGTAYIVGGFVRDELLGMEGGDLDVEVHGIPAEKLKKILSGFGELQSYGSSFGIYSIKGSGIDIALPRKEKASGRGHRDFEIYTDPFIGTLEAARRRDFTVNALMKNVLTGEIIDHFGGKADLENRVLRHIDSEHFPEDPLRVLRAARFSAVLKFDIAPETVNLCRTVDLSELSPERVEAELKRALLEADRPSVFFESLRKMDQLHDWFPELNALIGLPQDKIFHPEGDVWVHTMEVADRAAAFRRDVTNPYAFLLLALLHDVGKTLCTEEIDGRIHAYGHETLGVPLAEAFLSRITREKAVKAYVLNMLPLHMRPNVLAFSRSSVKSTNRLFDEADAPRDLIYFAMADKPVVSGNVPFSGDSGFLFERYEIYEKMTANPYITGKDLEAAGFEPGEYYKDVLAYARKLQLAGIDRNNGMKQVVSFAAKLRKKQKV